MTITNFSFNIPHDDERKCGHYMTLNKHNYHIMAPTLEYNTHPWSWSPCSAAMLAKFLEFVKHLFPFFICKSKGNLFIVRNFSLRC